MKVEIAPAVEADMESIADYIARDNPPRAVTFLMEIYEEIKAVGKHPLHYRLRPDVGAEARLAQVGRYVVLFKIERQRARIERVVHGARDLPSLAPWD